MQPLGSESSTLSLIWNGSGWYGFIGAILASTTDISPVVHLHAIGNFHMRVKFYWAKASPAVHQGFVSTIATQPKSIISWRLVMKTDIQIRSFATFC